MTYTETSMCQRFVNFEVPSSQHRVALNSVEEFLGGFYREADGVLYHKVTKDDSNPDELGISLCIIFSPDRS